MNSTIPQLPAGALAALVAIVCVTVGGAVFAVKGATTETAVIVLGLIGTVFSAVVPTLISQLDRSTNIEKIAQETKKVADVTHDLVNSSHTAMVAELKQLREELAMAKEETAKAQADKDSESEPLQMEIVNTKKILPT